VAGIDAHAVNKNVFDVRRHSGLPGNQLDCFCVGIQNEFGRVPSSNVFLIGVLQLLGTASLGRVEDQLEPRRRNLIREQQAPAASAN